MQALFEETNTGNRYRNSGTAWVLDRVGDVTELAKWIVYKAGTVYKAKSGVSGLTPYSGSNLKVDVWDNIVGNPTTNNNHIHFLNSNTPYHIASGSSLLVGPGGYDTRISGESPYGVKLRPLGNNIVLEFTNVRRFQLDNIGIYVDQGTAYTTDAIRLIGSAGGCEYVNFDNLYLRQDAGTSTITQTGRGVVMLLTGANPSISWFHCSDIMVQGFACAYKLATFAVTGTAPAAWSNENSFIRCSSQHSKAFFQLGTLLVSDQMWSWHWKDCGWQTTGAGVGADVTQDDMFDVDVFGTCLAICRDWHINNCIMWDPFSNVTKFFKASVNCRVLLEGGGAAPSGASGPLGDQWMGGAGFDAVNGVWNTGAYVERISPTAVSRGATSVADGGTINHRLLATPKVIICQPRVAGEVVSVTARTATNFTVAIKKFNPTAATQPLGIIAGTTQIVDWEAREFV